MQKVGIFLGAMLYGTCWAVGLFNLAAAVVAVPAGQDLMGYLPMVLLPFAMILYIHHLAGWIPFRHRQ